jgi:hypothetical protein
MWKSGIDLDFWVLRGDNIIRMSVCLSRYRCVPRAYVSDTCHSLRNPFPRFRYLHHLPDALGYYEVPDLQSRKTDVAEKSPAKLASPTTGYTKVFEVVLWRFFTPRMGASTS